MLVIFTTFMTGSYNEDVFSRCTSSLIVVCNKDAADKIVPESDCEFAYKIPVHGEIFIYSGHRLMGSQIMGSIG